MHYVCGVSADKSEEGWLLVAQDGNKTILRDSLCSSLRSATAGKRPHVTIYAATRPGKGPRLTALYDTGSAPCCIAKRQYDKAREAGVVGREIKNHGLKLYNASGREMPIFGVFQITMNIAGRRVRTPWVVLEKLSSDAIIGMSLIGRFDLRLDNSKQCVYWGRQQPQTRAWTTAGIFTTQQQVIQAQSIQHVKVKLRQQNSTPVQEGEEFVAEIFGLPTLGEVGRDGAAIARVCNATDQPIVIPRQCFMAVARPAEEWDLRPATAASVAEITGRKKTLLWQQPQQEEQPGKRMSQQDQQKIDKLIKEMVDRSHIREPFRSKFIALLQAYRDVISKDKHDLGLTKTLTHSIQMKDETPVYVKQFPLPASHRKEIEERLEEWLKADVVQVGRSLFNSPIFCVEKRSGALRVVQNMKGVNNKAVVDKYSIRTPQECIAEVGRADSKVFTTLDLTSGYWQMGLDEDSRKYTAFTLPGKGQYVWKRCPQGSASSPASFSRLMDIVMKDMPFSLTFMDDVLVHSKSLNAHLGHLEQALARLRQHGLKINPTKCDLAAEEVDYLGQRLTRQGIVPGKAKTKAIAEAPAPTSQRQVKSFVSLCNFFRPFIKDFAKIAMPLYRLTRQDSAWRRGQMPTEAAAAYHELKKRITSEPVLAYPRREGDYFLYVDGALGNEKEPGGLGACLMQLQDGHRRPLGYASRQLKEHERNYNSFLVELSAVVFGVKHFDVELRGRRFTVCADHRPLEKLSNTHTKTLHRLEQELLPYDFQVEYVGSEQNHVADFLSRTAALRKKTKEEDEEMRVEVAEVDVSKERVLKAMEEDEETSTVRKAILGEADWSEVRLGYRRQKSRMKVKDGLILIEASARKGEVDLHPVKLVLPKQLRHEVMLEAHAGVWGGHGGAARTTAEVRRDFWFPDLDKQVAQVVRECQTCQATSNKDAPTHVDPEHLPLARGVNQRVHVDLWGPVIDSQENKVMCAILTCAFSKFVQIAIVPTKSAEAVAKAIFEKWIAVFGVPRVLVSDQGKEFTNATQAALWQILGMKHTTTSPRHPRANAQAETFNKELAHTLRVLIHDENRTTKQWEDLIDKVAMIHNSKIHASTRQSPHFTMFGTEQRLPTWSDVQHYLGEDSPLELPDAEAKDFVYEWGDNLQRAREAAWQALQHDRDLRDDHQPQSKHLPPLKAQQEVWVRIMAPRTANKKLEPKWERGAIISREGMNTYKVRRLDAKRKKITVLHREHLKPRRVAQEEETAAIRVNGKWMNLQQYARHLCPYGVVGWKELQKLMHYQKTKWECKDRFLYNIELPTGAGGTAAPAPQPQQQQQPGPEPGHDDDDNDEWEAHGLFGQPEEADEGGTDPQEGGGGEALASPAGGRATIPASPSPLFRPALSPATSTPRGRGRGQRVRTGATPDTPVSERFITPEEGEGDPTPRGRREEPQPRRLEFGEEEEQGTPRGGARPARPPPPEAERPRLRWWDGRSGATDTESEGTTERRRHFGPPAGTPERVSGEWAQLLPDFSHLRATDEEFEMTRWWDSLARADQRLKRNAYEQWWAERRPKSRRRRQKDGD